MNIILMTFGSRGDIQPFLALALRERGHFVTLAAPIDFEEQAKSYSIPYLRIPLSIKDFLDKDFAKRILRDGINPVSLFGFWREEGYGS